MAAGDTISGQVRYVRRTQSGDEIVVAGPFSSTEMDQATLNQRVALNVGSGSGAGTPFGLANLQAAPMAKFAPGEVLLIQHKSASLAEAIDYDADEFEIQTIEKDLNTGVKRNRTLTVADTGLTANPTSSTTVWTSIFSFTVPDRRALMVKGLQKAAAVENA